MQGIAELKGTVRGYSWGDRTAIAALLGHSTPAPAPQAELWLGAHPEAPSQVRQGEGWVSLAALIEQAPEEILGARAAERFGGRLPFLMKVLAAAEPLSIQAHPDPRQAAAGCQREDALGIPRGAAHRNYRDGNAKPEVLCALEPFVMLRGFRAGGEIRERMERLGVADLLPESRLLDARPGAMERFFRAYMGRPPGKVGEILGRALPRIAEHAEGEDASLCYWIAELARRYPEDRGVLSPLFLHLLELDPGQAIYTGPGVLHTYLRGVGIELMTNSDNVLRGGLTPKHIDGEELVRVLRFEPQEPELLRPQRGAGGERQLTAPVDDFRLAVLEVTPGRPFAAREHGVEILLCVAGDGEIHGADGAAIPFARGGSFLVPAAAPAYRLTGAATLFRAAVPD